METGERDSGGAGLRAQRARLDLCREGSSRFACLVRSGGVVPYLTGGQGKLVTAGEKPQFRDPWLPFGAHNVHCRA